MSNIKIVEVKIQDLKPAIYNPRKWSDEAIAGLTASIKQFGLVDPILANGAENRRDVVIGGHFRLKVAKDLGHKEVPVVYVDIPDEAKKRSLIFGLIKTWATGITKCWQSLMSHYWQTSASTAKS